MVALIRSSLSKDFRDGHFKKFVFFFGIWPETSHTGSEKLTRLDGRAGTPLFRLDFCARWNVASGGAVCLRLFFNLVNDHAARPVIHERLRVIAVACMHPHA